MDEVDGSEIASHQSIYAWGGKLNIIMSILIYLLCIVEFALHLQTQISKYKNHPQIQNESPSLSPSTKKSPNHKFHTPPSYKISQKQKKQVSKKMSNQFITHNKQTIHLTQIFNQQHASIIIQQKLSETPNFDTVVVKNVGIKIMKDAFDKFVEHPITDIQLEYNWNYIMMMPKLVCYDKNTWKTLQQLANWNREWSLAFRNCLSLQRIKIDVVSSWADDQWIKAVLEGLAALPNIKEVDIRVVSKNQKVGEMLEAFKKAKIFEKFNAEFVKYV